MEPRLFIQGHRPAVGCPQEPVNRLLSVALTPTSLTSVPSVVSDKRALGPKGSTTELALMVLAAAVRYHVGLEDAALWGRGSKAQGTSLDRSRQGRQWALGPRGSPF